MKIRYKLKLYPITEDGEEIYCGGFLDVIRIEFDTKSVYTKVEYTDALRMLTDNMMYGHRLDVWHYGDNRDERDQQSELWASIDDNEYLKISE